MTLYLELIDMKKTFKLILAIALLGTLFHSCSTDVDLYADYKDITVVYGLLDPIKDTNYIKINKAFLGPGNAIEIAHIADSCNYPEKLNCRLVEYRAPYNSTNWTKLRVLELDTITIHNKDTMGFFYAPDQLVYYTKERIRENTEYHNFVYELEIDRGDTTLRAKTNIVGGPSFSITQGVMTLSSTHPLQGSIKWYPCPYASIYDVAVQFRYIELTPSHDSVLHHVDWNIGTHPLSDLIGEYGTLSTSYNAQVFYQALALEIGNDSLKDVERLIAEPSLTVKISAGGDDLYNFITVNGPSNSIAQNVPEYTNVIGGYGVFSSRTSIEKNMRLTSQSYLDIKNHESWHFRQSRDDHDE